MRHFAGESNLTLTSSSTDRKFYYTPHPEKKLGTMSKRTAASTVSDGDEPLSTRRAGVEVKSADGLQSSSPMKHELPQREQPLPSLTKRMTESRNEDFLTLPTANDVDIAESISSISSTSESSWSSLHDSKRTTLVPVRHPSRRDNSSRPARKCLFGTRTRGSSIQPSNSQRRGEIERRRRQRQATIASSTKSFGDTGVSDGPVHDGQPPATAPSFFPGNKQLCFAPTAQYHQRPCQDTTATQQSQLQVYHTTCVPRPHFERYMVKLSSSGFAHAQDPQTANPPVPMPNYEVPMDAQSIPSAAAQVPYLPLAASFHEDQSHPIYNWEYHDCQPKSCRDSAGSKLVHFQQMPQPYGEPWEALNHPTQVVFDRAVQNLPLQYGGPATGHIGGF